MLIVVRIYAKKLNPHEIPLSIKSMEVKKEQVLTKSQHCLRRESLKLKLTTMFQG